MGYGKLNSGNLSSSLLIETMLQKPKLNIDIED